MDTSTPTDLPNLDAPYLLTADQIECYQRDGWILLRGVCSPEEISAYRDVIVEAARKNNNEKRPLEERDTYGRAFLQIMNLWQSDEAVRQFVLSRRFAQIAAQLMAVEGVRLYHDQALFKEPGGGHTPWHQDQFYWPLSCDRTITMWMPLIEVSEVMGSMTFADASQNDGFVPMEEQISDASEEFFDEWVNQHGYNCPTSGAMAAGDATFHSGYTLHRAPGNVTNRVREVMTVIYYPDGTVVQEPANSFQANDLKTWLAPRQPGDLAAGPLNPLLWP